MKQVSKFVIIFVYAFFYIFQSTFCIVPNSIETAIRHKYPRFTNPVLIGKGEDREVWGSPTSNLAIKGTRNKILCGKYTNALKYLKKAHQALIQHDRDRTFRQRASFPIPQKLDVVDEVCLLSMERLYPVKEETEGLLTQMYLGHATYNQRMRDEKLVRGYYKGYEQIEQIVNGYPRINATQDNMQQLCYDLGKLFAIMQLAAKVDGLGCQVCLVKQSKTSAYYKIAILSLFQANDVASLFSNDKIQMLIDKLHKTLIAENYFPIPTIKGFANFRQGYIDFAEKLSRDENNVIYNTIAVQLFKKHIKNWIKNYLLPNYIQQEKELRKQYYQYCQAIGNDSSLLEPLQKHMLDTLKTNNYYMEEENLFKELEKKLFELTSSPDLADFQEKIQARPFFPKT